MPPRKSLRFDWKHYRGGLLAELDGHVFHATSCEGLIGIESDGAIRTNEDGNLSLRWGSHERSFFTRRGCVCVVDLRTATPDEVRDGLDAYNFLEPGRGVHCFLILSEGAVARLQTSDVYESEGKGKGIGFDAVAVIEAGHPGPIPLKDIDSIIVATKRPKPAEEMSHVDQMAAAAAAIDGDRAVSEEEIALEYDADDLQKWNVGEAPDPDNYPER